MAKSAAYTPEFCNAVFDAWWLDAKRVLPAFAEFDVGLLTPQRKIHENQFRRYGFKVENTPLPPRRNVQTQLAITAPRPPVVLD